MPTRPVAPPAFSPVETRELWGMLCIRMDGQWFVKCKDRLGLEAAMALNETAVHAMGRWEIAYGAEALGLAPPFGPAEAYTIIAWLHDPEWTLRVPTGLHWHSDACWNAVTAEATGVAHLGPGAFPGCRGFSRRMDGWMEALGPARWHKRVACALPADGGCDQWLDYDDDGTVPGAGISREAPPVPTDHPDWATMGRDMGRRWFCEWAKAVREAHGVETARELEERVSRAWGRIAGREALQWAVERGTPEPGPATLAFLWPGAVQYDASAHALVLINAGSDPWAPWAASVGVGPYADGRVPGAATQDAWLAGVLERLFPDSPPAVTLDPAA